MKKLTKQSPLFDITKLINDIVDEINNNRDVYENFKPDIKSSISKSFNNDSIPGIYEASIMGLYKIELKAENSRVRLEIFRNEESRVFDLNIQNKVVENIFLSKGDRIVLKEGDLKTNESLCVSLEMNILDAFVDQYETSKSSIKTMEGILGQSKVQFEEIEDTINKFYSNINFEEVSPKELAALIAKLEE